MRCDDVTIQMAGVVDGSATLDRRAARHAAGCLRCQAELAHYRRLRRSLRQLAFEPVMAPAGLADSVIRHLEHAGSAVTAGLATGDRASSPWARRAAYAGAVAATAAGAAGAIVLVASRRRGRGALGAIALGA